MFDPLHLHELDHPSLAREKTHQLLALDVLIYRPKALLVKTRQGEVWLPKYATYFDAATASKKDGFVLHVHASILQEKFPARFAAYTMARAA